MKKKIIFSITLILLILLATACSAASKSSAAATQAASAQTDPNASLESRLAMGTLMLEGTSNAVTADEAKTLLPLWKAIKSMSSSDTATTEEIQAVYTQIQEAMTADQITAIKALDISQESMSSLMTKLGIDPAQFAGGPNVSSDQRSTQRAQFQAQGGELPAGGFTFQGGQPPAGGGNFPSGGNFNSGNPPAGFEPGGAGGTGGTTTGTQTAGSGTQRRFGGVGQLFLDPLIKLLTERAAS